MVDALDNWKTVYCSRASHRNTSSAITGTDPTYMMQTASTSGNCNFIVQIQGDGNSIVNGLPHLGLTRRHGPASRIQTDPDTSKPWPTDVIRPFTRSIDLVGREMELDELRVWLEKETPISVRVITGDAGCGKTRLALELIEEVVPQGWHAGFLTRAELKRFREQRNLADWGWHAPTLVVVDYASASVRDLHAWLKELADSAVWEEAQATTRFPLRLLLLERQAERGRGWWAEVFGRGDDAGVLEKLADPDEPVGLRPLDDAGQRRAILTKTLECLGSAVTLPTVGDDPYFDRRLAELTWAGVPLLLMLAAATAAREGFGQVLAMGSQDLAFHVAGTELARILKVVESQNVSTSLAPLVEHVAAVVTLRQGLTAEAAREVIERESDELGYGLPNGSAALRDALAMALPNDAGGIAAVEPDMIGEATMLSVWREDNTQAIPAIARAHAADPDVVAETVVRTCQNYVVRGHRHPLNWLEKIRTDRADFYALVHLHSMMPTHTLEMREVAAELTKTLVDQARHLVGDELDLDEVVILAGTLNNLANRLFDLGRRKEALDAIEEAVDLYRFSASIQPDAFRSGLAASLVSLSRYRSEFGQSDGALDAIEEAVAILSGLTAAGPDVVYPDLAASLHNLSVCLSNLGRHDEALVTIEKAVGFYRDLAATRPDHFRSELDESLNNLSICLTNLGRHDEALVAIEEAVGIRRALAAAEPDAFRPGLLLNLSNLTTCLSKLGRRKEALSASQEAVAICRELADTRPDAFRPELAGCLNDLSNRFSELGLREDALIAIEEATAIRRDFADVYRDAFLPDLATTLSNLSNRFSALGRWGEALVAIEEAVAIRRALAVTTPDALQLDVISDINALSMCLSKLGRHEDALATIEEAVDLCCGLVASAGSKASRPDLATALNHLSDIYSALGQHDEALAAIEEAVAIRRVLAANSPGAFRFELAVALRNLSLRFSNLGLQEDALAAIEEAVAASREPFLAHPMFFGNHMALILAEYSNRCNDAGREEPDPALYMPILEALQRLNDRAVE